MISVLVTGKDSQLARCIKDKESDFSNLSMKYYDSKTLNITDINSIEDKFKKEDFDFCINCAAYTNVEKAENEPEKARAVNTTGVANISKVCRDYNVKLIHISTDFVFDGKKTSPYFEDDKTNPLSVYGKSKRDGELEIVKNLKEHFIIRTAWLYSEYGQNFLKTVIKMSKEKNQISVVNDQMGSPTYAGDLANAILKIIESNSKEFGIYHLCNFGETSWYEFATEIVRRYNLPLKIIQTSSKTYKTKAKRPVYSVLNSQKAFKVFHVKLDHWQESLDRFCGLKNLSI